MNIQDRYDEVDNIVMTIDLLLTDIKDKNYYDALMEIKLEAEAEKEELEEQLKEEQLKEEREQLKQYWDSQF
jgi:hypothetical protein